MSDEIIQSDFQACDDLLCSEESRDDFIEANIERLPIWKESAESGDACGQLLYGLCYFYGHGVEESDELAIEWFEKAATQGHQSAIVNLDSGSVEGPYVKVTCGRCGTCDTFELSDIAAGEAYENDTRCLERNDWDYSDRVLCPACKES